MDDQSQPTKSEYAIKTWRYLRLAMVALVTGLAASVVYEVVQNPGNCTQESISAYYYTHARAIFVGSLMAIGVCLICLRGSTEWEDILLNLAGMLAFVVALVPTPNAGDCASLPGLPADPTPNIENNIVALLVAGAAAFLILAGLSIFEGRRRARASQRWPEQAALIGYVVAMGVLAAVGLVLWRSREWFVAHAHGWAAVVMFSCIIAVAGLNAVNFKDKQYDENVRNRYFVIAVLMLVSVFGALLVGGSHHILWAESAAIFFFALFWGVQTQELWDEGLRTPSGGHRS